jgi:hypothetical protein
VPFSMCTTTGTTTRVARHPTAEPRCQPVNVGPRRVLAWGCATPSCFHSWGDRGCSAAAPRHTGLLVSGRRRAHRPPGRWRRKDRVSAG